MATLTRRGGDAENERPEGTGPGSGMTEHPPATGTSSSAARSRATGLEARRPRRRVRRSSTVVIGLGALILIIVTALAGEISSLNLLDRAKVAIFVLVVMAGIASTVWESTRARRADEDMRGRDLEAALAGDVTRPLAERSARGVGVRPGPGAFGAYQRRGEDEELERALRENWIVCVVGPPGSGKTRAAFEALKRVRPGARLIAPVDGKALETILAAQYDLFIALDRAERRDAARAYRGATRSLRSLFHRLARRLPWSYNEVDYVLWLDGLQRFIPTINVNELIRFLGAPPTESPKARLVATIREEDLAVLVGAANDESHRARDLLSRAEQVAYEGSDAASPTVAGAGPPDSEPNEGLDEIRTLPTRTGRLGLFFPWLAPIVAASWIAALWVTNHGLTVPPALAAQERAVAASLQPCDVAAPAPADDAHYWILPVEAGSCPGSDYVRIYAIDHGHLELSTTATPRDPSRIWWFRCADPSRCAFPAGGSRRIVVGEFVDPDHHALPLVIYRQNGAIYKLAPYLARFGNHSDSRTTLYVTGPEPASWRPGQCGNSRALCGYPPTYIAATALDDQPGRVLLIAGYAVGHWYAPKMIITRAFDLSFQRGRVVFDPTQCGRNGQTLTVTLKARLTGDPRSAMIAAWRREQFVSPLEC